MSELLATFEQTMYGLERAFLVQHVATEVETANASESMTCVFARGEASQFNNLPVQRDGQIVGVVENILGEVPDQPRPKRSGAAGDHGRMRALAGDMLIEARQPLSQLADELLRPPHYRLVVGGGQLDAIVTPSDLGKLPMRVMAFAALAHLESTMTSAIGSRFRNDEDAIASLGEDAEGQVLGALQRLHDKGLDPGLLEVTSFKQKGAILGTTDVFTGQPSKVAEEFADLYDGLRNPLAHGVEFVNDSIETLQLLQHRLDRVEQRINQAARV